MGLSVLIINKHFDLHKVSVYIVQHCSTTSNICAEFVSTGENINVITFNIRLHQYYTDLVIAFARNNAPPEASHTANVVRSIEVIDLQTEGSAHVNIIT